VTGSVRAAAQRAYYSATLTEFCAADPDVIFGRLARQNDFDLIATQRDAWLEQARILQVALSRYAGSIYLEFTIPRMGRRVDAIIIIGSVIFVLEFKVGEKDFRAQDIDQVADYALDLQNFHEGSHGRYIAPVLVCTHASDAQQRLPETKSDDGLFAVARTNATGVTATIGRILHLAAGPPIAIEEWESSRYKPTPTIIEATLALYRGHSVTDISRSDAGASNLSVTAKTVARILEATKARREKAICFITGVPGAGKTLVGLDAATKHISREDELYSVFLSGNGPLVAILQEALARDKMRQSRLRGTKIRKGSALSEVRAFIQNVHHFRDECLLDVGRPPIEHVAIFDEAQRAWNVEQTAYFMRRKKGRPDFAVSEPEFLISCLNRHRDWAVIICLVGGGQEINTGEAGIGEWFDALDRSFRDWKIYVSGRLVDNEYGANDRIQTLQVCGRAELKPELHLATSIRSFRSEKVSMLVEELLDLNVDATREALQEVLQRYPIVLTRDVNAARNWLRGQARGTERYGIVVSSQAERLKPHAVDVRTPIDPVHWFLDGKDDVRSSYYLEDVATEFHVQGLELDWVCVVWDADFRFTSKGWEHWSFRGNRWQRIQSIQRRRYLKNAYRVLLTRARQGMVLVVPHGDDNDPTRHKDYYDLTFKYLRDSGISLI
jgi:hypothetical protein